MVTSHLPLRNRLQNDLLDPINRLYRYRLANGLAQKMRPLNITPNQVTIAHTCVGVFAAFLVFERHYVLAAFTYELRTILDCLDGVLAREQNRVTAFGRTLDTLGDGISFNALMIAGALRMIQDFPNYKPVMIALGVFIFAFTTAHSGTVYHLMRRKLGSILEKHLDTVEIEWREYYEKVQKKNPLLLAHVGFWIDSVTIRFVSKEWYKKIRKRRDMPEWKEKALNEALLMNELAAVTRKSEFKRAVRSTAFVSDDNIFSVISFCFILQGIFPNQIFPHVHPVLVAFSAGFIYAVMALIIGLHFLHDFLHGVYRE
jgi:phosphatidylglycerophosphate synthase